MSQYRVFSMLAYGAAALVGAALLSSTTIPGAVAVGLPFALAAVADRFVNRNAEPDETWVLHKGGTLPLKAYNTDVSLVLPNDLREGDRVRLGDDAKDRADPALAHAR
jgi:hypothetical protein